jgi:hypothetical protein
MIRTRWFVDSKKQMTAVDYDNVKTLTLAELLAQLQAKLADPSSGVTAETEVYVSTLGAPDRIVDVGTERRGAMQWYDPNGELVVLLGALEQ